MSFTKHKIEGTTPRHLFNSEIEREIENFADKNNLHLPFAFSRYHYDFFSEIGPEIRGLKYCIVFLARPKTPDEILGKQIEFQIKQMEQ